MVRLNAIVVYIIYEFLLSKCLSNLASIVFTFDFVVSTSTGWRSLFMNLDLRSEVLELDL